MLWAGAGPIVQVLSEAPREVSTQTSSILQVHLFSEGNHHKNSKAQGIAATIISNSSKNVPQSQMCLLQAAGILYTMGDLQSLPLNDRE